MLLLRRTDRGRTAAARPRAGGNRIAWILLAAAVVVMAATVYRGLFTDEADNLVGAALITHGRLLYRDVFSHHFPLAYYWTALGLALFGRSILAARLFTALFQFICLLVCLRATRNRVAVAAVALLWALARPFYFGNLVLYSSLSGPALLVVFVIGLEALRAPEEVSARRGALAGLFAGLAILADPIAVYPLAVAALFIAARRPRPGLVLPATAGGVLALAAAGLWLTGSLSDFYAGAVRFNLDVYSRYTTHSAVRFGLIWTSLHQGLGIADPRFWQMDPWRPLGDAMQGVDCWLFTGLAYRAGILAAAGGLAWRRKFAAAALVVLYPAALTGIGPHGFRGQGFALLGLFALALTATGEWRDRAAGRAGRGLQLGAMILAAASLGWLGLRTGIDLFLEEPASLSYRANFAGPEGEVAALKRIACGRSDVALSQFPGATYPLWFTGLEPVAGYAYLWPWTAEVGLPAVIEDLDSPGRLALVTIHDQVVWDAFDTRVYLRPLHEFLESRYWRIEPGVHVSPALVARCNLTEARPPAAQTLREGGTIGERGLVETANPAVRGPRQHRPAGARVLKPQP